MKIKTAATLIDYINKIDVSLNPFSNGDHLDMAARQLLQESVWYLHLCSKTGY